MLETFDLWWPERLKVRVRYNGDMYPFDLFLEGGWKLDNINLDSWTEIARRQQRYSFAAKKTLVHPMCEACEWQQICHGGCSKHRHDGYKRFEDLDHLCGACNKMIFGKCVQPLKKKVAKSWSNNRRSTRPVLIDRGRG